MNPTGASVDYDLEALLPLEVIRAHTKTNDIPTVEDDQLKLYRSAAFEAAEAYTGLWLRGDHFVTETIDRPKRPGQRRRLHKLRWPSRDGLVYVQLAGAAPYTEYLNPGARRIVIRELAHQLDLGNCCNPCGSIQDDRLMYRTGLKCLADFPAGIRMGMLRYIAFTLANPGDIASTWTNDRFAAAARQVLNDAVKASGAAAEWARYRVGEFV